MNKKINQLSTRTAVGTDLALVGDPSTGTSYKTTFAELPLVPYTGATGAVNLGAYDLTVNGLTVGRGAGGISTNAVLGNLAGASFSTAGASVAIGFQALNAHSTGNWNTAVGINALARDVDGIGNTAIGAGSLVTLITGENIGNTAIGFNGLTRLSSGNYNTWLGYTIGTAGILTSGSYNTILGAQINVGVASLSNNIILADGQGNIRFRDDATSTILSRLQGTGTRIVLSDTNGALSTTPTGDTTQYVAGDGSLVAFPITGQAGTLVREVRNVTGATLTKGTVVYINGASGNKPTVTKAIATGDATSAQTFGIIQADISNNSNGYVVAVGDLDGLDTSAFADGDQLYLSSTVAGAYTTTKQYAPNHLVYIGVVTRSHVNQGRIEVRIQNGYEMDELHNVSAQSPANNDGLFWNSTTNLWSKNTIGGVLGYTPQAALTLTTTGTSGAATLVGATLNIPQYSGGGGGSMAIGGAITSATAGSVLFAGASGVLQQDNANLFWDDTNNRLGIGTATPTRALDVASDILVNGMTVGRGNGNFIDNISLGFETLNSATGSGGSNVAIGYQCLKANTTGHYNVGIGYRALNANTTARGSIAIGFQALLVNTGEFNTGIGATSLQANTTGSQNIGIGYFTLRSNITGSNNVAIGANCLQANTTNSNTGIGAENLNANSSGSGNTSIGYQGLTANTSGSFNTSIGYQNLWANTTGANNTSIGYRAGLYTGTGTVVNAITNNSIYIGYDTRALASNQTNQIVIGYNETGLGSNTTIIGNSSTITTALRGRLILGTTTDSGLYQADINGSTRVNQLYLRALNTAPATASSTGTLGEIRIDASYIYVCTATNTWVRSALTTW